MYGMFQFVRGIMLSYLFAQKIYKFKLGNGVRELFHTGYSLAEVLKNSLGFPCICVYVSYTFMP